MNNKSIQMIGFDADDTLWEGERLYVRAQAKFRELLSPTLDAATIDERLLQTELRNLKLFGYGSRGFVLSMIETAVELTEGRISGHDVQAIVNLGREMLESNVELLAHAVETLERLSAEYPLILITKGDLLDQEGKIAKSGIGRHFRHIEVVSEKHPDTYAVILDKYGIPPERFLMVGNSLRSDILPVLEIGGRVVYVPHSLTWSYENEAPAPPADHAGFYEIEHLGQLPDLLDGLVASTRPRTQSLLHVALVVSDYDEAIDFYCGKLHFSLVEDTYQPEQDKRWVTVAPPGSSGTTLLLARAATPEQEAFIGRQTGGRVFLFLSTDDFWRDYEEMRSAGIRFVREPKTTAYGTVAVFEDLYGNLWDLIEPSKNAGK